MSGAWWGTTRNPVVGCSPPTPAMRGCEKCWAQRFAMRQITREGPTGDAYRAVIKNGRWTGETRFVESALKRVPGKGKVVFVSDMGDLWHTMTKTSWIAQVLDWARKHPQHTFVNCTKRPKRASEWTDHIGPFPDNWVQLVSVEDQESADERIPHIVECKAKIRGLHIEPLLGPVDLRDYLVTTTTTECGDEYCCKAIGWTVVGCETGPGARPCKTEWIQKIVSQCEIAGVPVWVKKAPESNYRKLCPWPRQKPEGVP